MIVRFVAAFRFAAVFSEGLVTVFETGFERAVWARQRWLIRKSSMLCCLTVRAADTASPWGSGGGFEAE